MGLFDIFKKKQSQTHIDYNKVVFDKFGRAVILSDISSKQDYVDKGYRKNATIYSIVELITKSASNVPIKVYKKKDSNALKEYKSLTSGAFNDAAYIKANIIRSRALQPASESELANILNNPNPDMGYSQFIQEAIAFKLITGDSYIQGIRPKSGVNKGKIKQLYTLPSHLVEIVGGTIQSPVEGYKLKYLNADPMPLSYEDVCHVKNFNPDYSVKGSHLYGQSPLQAAYRNLEINNDAITTGKKFLANQGARGILSSDDNMLTPEQAKIVKAKYKAQYQGADNAGDIMVTSHAFKWIDMGLPAADIALIDQYNLSVKDLCNIYRIPVVLLNSTENSTYNNFREAKKQLYLQAVFPELISFRDELNRWLAPTYGEEYYIDFDFMSVPELMEDMEKTVKSLSLAWWITPNEKREVMKFEPLDDEKMDQVFMLANYIPLSDGVTPSEMGGGSVQMMNDSRDYLRKEEGYDDYPESASNNAKKVLKWKEEYGDEVTAMTSVGWRRARQLANREKLSRDVVSRMAQFNRHRSNAEVADEYKDTPWKDNGYVAWLGWGGTSGINWAIEKMKQLDK